jgi:16S rRNA (cytidine1402-2'-O)-methyltransferase
MKKGTLYLIPVPLGDSRLSYTLPAEISKIVQSLKFFVVENEKTARRHLRYIYQDIDQSSLKMQVLNQHTPDALLASFIEPCLKGYDLGFLSEAGCPAVADPGSQLVRLCHENDIKVQPLIGPSSILLTLMASGLGGQNFAFNGYLPNEKSDRKKMLKTLERESHQKKQTQLFMETPYRNEKLFHELIDQLGLDTSYLSTIKPGRVSFCLCFVF